MTEMFPSAMDVLRGTNKELSVPQRPGMTKPDKETSAFDRIAPYPKSLSEEAYYGIAGQFVRLVEPHTEADPNFLLISFLIYAGNVFGRTAFMWAGGDRHFPNLFGCAVGPTATGGRGPQAVQSECSSKKLTKNGLPTVSSLASRRVRVSYGPSATRSIPLVERLRANAKQTTQTSALTLELQTNGSSSFSRNSTVLCKRSGDREIRSVQLCATRGTGATSVRWSKTLRSKSSNAHISIIANITREELLRDLLAQDMDNGFANRFLWICSRRSKCLPEGGRIWSVDSSRYKVSSNDGLGL